jgi:hypothetical protein
MAKLIFTDGIALLKLSRSERYLLGRHYIAFELDRILKVSAEETPKKDALGQKVKYGWLPFTRTGEYQNGARRTLFIGPKKDRCVRVLLLSSSFDELYLTFGEQFELFALLKGNQSGSIYPKD